MIYSSPSYLTSRLPSCKWKIADVWSDKQAKILKKALSKDNPSKKIKQQALKKLKELDKQKKIARLTIWQPKTAFKF